VAEHASAIGREGDPPVLRPVADAEHRVLIADRHCYSSHPHCVAADGELLVVFSQSVRRPVVHHPLSDPLFRNLTIRSADSGRTWQAPRAAPGYDWSGVECAGLTALGGGVVVLNQWKFRWYTPEQGAVVSDGEPVTPAGEFSAYQALATGSGETWWRGGGTTYLHRSADGGRTWPQTIVIDTAPFSGGYGIRGAVRLPDSDLLLALSDVPAYRVVFTVRSADQGLTWAPPVIAADVPGRFFEEPALTVLPDQMLLMLLRESVTGRLYRIRSSDGGATWELPVDTGITGCPPHLLVLTDGRVLCSYGYRSFPFEIRAAISADGGATWEREHLVIASELGSRDIGYPSTVLVPGGLLCVYYGQLFDGTPAILATRFGLPGLPNGQSTIYRVAHAPAGPPTWPVQGSADGQDQGRWCR